MKYTCLCGAKYRMTTDAAGRRARCKACGVIFVVPSSDATRSDAAQAIDAIDEEIEAPPDPGLSGSVMSLDDYAWESTAAHGLGALDDFPGELDAPLPRAPDYLDDTTLNVKAKTDADAAIDQARKKRRHGFWPESLRSFAMVARPWNAIAVVACGALVGAASVSPHPAISVACLALFGVYAVNTVIHAATGDEDLPAPGDWDGVWNSVLAPLIRFLCTFVVLLLPGVAAIGIGMTARAWTHRLDSDTALLVLSAGIGVFVLGSFFWPASVLAVSMIGLGAMTRIGTLLRAVNAALFPYLVVWTGFVAALCMHLVLHSALIPSSRLRAADSFADVAAIGALPGAIVGLLAAYLILVSMRVIGLFYKHFHWRFAWGPGSIG